ncbi:conserved hypothetical protein [Ricinus communis]|uniref:Uncharacterized protein n=1 Tax=Ricinus communis TaxID=3988 RepID=B9RRP4_RICCO|nr:conserved hypothetical protein [Ricinus communis]
MMLLGMLSQSCPFSCKFRRTLRHAERSSVYGPYHVVALGDGAGVDGLVAAKNSVVGLPTGISHNNVSSSCRHGVGGMTSCEGARVATEDVDVLRSIMSRYSQWSIFGSPTCIITCGTSNHL